MSNALEYGPRYLVGYGESPPNAKWPNNAKIAINLVLNYEEGSEATPVNGDKQANAIASELGPARTPMEGVRDVNQESLYEYGSRAGVWRLMRLFKEFNVKCTVFANGQALEKNEAVAAAFVREDHEVASHGYRWVDRSAWSADEEEDFVENAIGSILLRTEKTPVGWYYGMVDSKAAERSRGIVANLYKQIEKPLKYYSDDYSDDLPHYIPYPGGKEDEGLLIIPYALDSNDYKNAGYQAFVAPEQFTSYLCATFDELYREGEAGTPKMMSVGLHPRIVGRPARVAALRKFLEYATAKSDVWFATREEIADHWLKTHPYKAGATPL